MTPALTKVGHKQSNSKREGYEREENQGKVGKNILTEISQGVPEGGRGGLWKTKFYEKGAKRNNSGSYNPISQRRPASPDKGTALSTIRQPKMRGRGEAYGGGEINRAETTETACSTK